MREGKQAVRGVKPADPQGRPEQGIASLDWWTGYLASSAVFHDAKGVELVELVVERIETPIQRGLLNAGDRLPPERLLATEMGVSRATLREALHELELKGLVERRQGRGTAVADTTRGEVAHQLLTRLGSEQRAVLEIMDFREATEVPIAARAARYATKADMARLERILDRMESEVSGERYAELDRRFHHIIASATHNSLLVQIVEWSSQLVTPTRAPGLEGARRRRISLDGHRAIVQCIRERDAEGAAAAMERHIRALANELASQAGTDATEPKR